MLHTKTRYEITPFPHIIIDVARKLPVISYAPGRVYPLDQLFAEMQLLGYNPREMASHLRGVTGGMMTKGMIFCALAYLEEHPELREQIAKRRSRMWRYDDIFDCLVAPI